MLTSATQALVDRTGHRIASVDAYRGFVMFLMLAEVLRTCDVSTALATSELWRFVCFEQTHAAWIGCSLHDLIQPSFYFLVGIGLFLSMTRRLSLGQTRLSLTRHVLVRSLTLVLLGMVLVAVHPRHWSWNFVDTLTQIGLAYPFLFLITLRPKRDWYFALGLILLGYWLWFALAPAPPVDFEYENVGVSRAWLSDYGLHGFSAHWQKNANVAAAFDRWFLSKFPVDAPHRGYTSGLTTLNFIPSIGTMILGLLAGDVLRSPRPPRDRIHLLAVSGAVLIVVGWMLGVIGVCPVVKAIWTPSWVLFSGGWCLLCLAGFSTLVDVKGVTWAVFPLVVIGANSIVAYAMSHVYPAVAFNSFRRLFGPEPFLVFGTPYEPFIYGCTVFAMYWLALFILYRRRIFIRI
jgi:heparan-alpha-glucosaminide N-acetyltransferase